MTDIVADVVALGNAKVNIIDEGGTITLHNAREGESVSTIRTAGNAKVTVKRKNVKIKVGDGRRAGARQQQGEVCDIIATGNSQVNSYETNTTYVVDSVNAQTKKATDEAEINVHRNNFHIIAGSPPEEDRHDDDAPNEDDSMQYPVQAEQDLEAEERDEDTDDRRAEMHPSSDKINVILQLGDGKRINDQSRIDHSFATALEIREFIDQQVPNWGYKLSLSQTGAKLLDEQTLIEAGVNPGDTIYAKSTEKEVLYSKDTPRSNKCIIS